jgi:CheY-like chemotaxis protein
LIVEDNTANIFALEHFLRYHGFNLAVAGNGREAIQQVLSLRPNLVLMDIQMPEMDGITAIKHIRADKAIAKTPIIAVSASVMPGDKERSLLAGADEFIGKPYKMKDLIVAIQRVLHKSGQKDP